jgi:hypothetical protein
MNRRYRDVKGFELCLSVVVSEVDVRTMFYFNFTFCANLKRAMSK